MKRIVAVLVMVVVCAAVAQAKVEPNPSGAPRWGVEPGVVVVKLKPDVEPARTRSVPGTVATGLPVVDEVAARVRASAFEQVFPHERKPASGSVLHDLTRFYRLHFDAVRDPAQVAEALAADPGVELAEIVTWHATDQFIPNDPRFVDQWHHRESDTQDNDIDSPEAWAAQTGDPDIIVAIFDTGVLWYHPDLLDQIWVNPGEDLDGDEVVYDADDINGVDDDGNGKVDDLIGWDFVIAGSGCAVGEDCVLADNDPRDFDGHGTHVAGIAAAATNNARDGAGVAGGRYPLQRGCLIMPCRAGWATTDGLGAVRTDWVGEGVNYAVANGAKVGNLSAGAGQSSILSSALSNAFAEGFIFTWAAGNDNTSTPEGQMLVDFPGVIAVAATNQNDQKSSFSNYGLWVEISAPGSAIYSTYGADGVPSFVPLQGTSMAAPMVAGCAALVYANNPSFTKTQVETTLYATADSIDYLNPAYAHMLGAGRVNIGAALASLPQADFTGDFVLPPTVSATGAAAAAALAPDTPLVAHYPFTVGFADASPGTPTSWQWDFGDGGDSPDQNPQHEYTAAGIYDVTLDATHAEGTGRKRHQSAVVAQADTVFGVNGKNCPGKKASVELYLTNELPVHQLILPFTYQGAGNMALDSFSFAGTRIEYFEEKKKEFSSVPNKFAVFKLTADNGGGSPPLAAGSGPILKLYFTIGVGVETDTLSPVDTFTVLNFHYKATTLRDIDYVPGFRLTGVDISPYCRGDFNCDGAVTAADVISTVLYVFKGGPQACDPWVMDVTGDDLVTATDLVFLVNYIFKTGPAPE